MLVPIYACPVLTTPMHAFVHDMSPGLSSFERRIVNIYFVRLCICPVLATLTCAFIHNMSSGLANLARRLVNNIFFPAHHYFNTTAPMTNLAPLCARNSTTTSSTPSTLTRHRPRHSSHGYTTHALGYIDNGTKDLLCVMIRQPRSDNNRDHSR